MNTRKQCRTILALTTVQLQKLCDQAETLRFSNGPTVTFWEDVDPNGFHVVGFWFLHRPNLAFWESVDHPWNFAHGGGKNIRALVMCKMRGKLKPQELLCDFDYEAFMEIAKRSRKVKSRQKKAALAK